MKKSELVFTAILVPLDYLLVFLAALSAYSLRFGYVATLRPVIFEMPFRDYLGFSAIASIIFILLFALSGLYGVRGPRRITHEVSRIFIASSAAIMTAVVVIFFKGEYFSSRFIVLAAWFFAVIYVSSGRVFIRLLQRFFLRFGVGTHRVILIGGDDAITKLLTKVFSKHPGFGYRIVKRVHRFDDASVREIDALVETRSADEIIVADPDIDRADLARILGYAESHHLTFRYSADILTTHAKNIEIGTIAGIPIVEIKGTRLDGWGRIYKRFFDIVGSLILIVLASPIMLAVAAAIVIDSKGPVLFRKLDDGSPLMRVGEHNEKFRYFKFRSMKPGTDRLRYEELAHLDTRSGPLIKIKDDPRVTRVGRFIRKFSIDELPELFLVLKGKMSMVGPRPHLPEEVEKYKDHQRRVLTIKPGMTGLAQVSGRSDLSFDEEVNLDVYYIENWSPWLDLAILIRTPLAVLKKRSES